ncbi:hypothetical protein IGP11_16025, partial [Escherichia coli]
MKKLICIAGLLFATASIAGPYAEIAKSKFESAMLEALQATNANQKKINEGMSQFPAMEKQMRGNDSNLLIVFYVQIMPDDFVMQLHR